MIFIAICDDEYEQRKSLKKEISLKLELQGAVYQIEEFESGEALLAETRTFDIVFLDTEMPFLSGIDTAIQLTAKEVHTVIIFVSQHADFAINSDKVQAHGIIFKPFTSRKINDILVSALKELTVDEQVLFAFSTPAQNYRLPLEDIFYFESDKRKITIYAKDETFSFQGRLDEIKGKLPETFIRTHQRYIVNIHFVDKTGTGSCEITNISLPVSRQHASSLSIAFAKFVLN